MKYFVFVDTSELRECPKFDKLEEAIEKYNSVEKKTLRDVVTLGIQSDYITPSEGFCFDVIHKFLDDEHNILINDYLNHTESEISEAVKQIISQLTVRFQFTNDILNGALIDYGTSFAPETGNVNKEWNDAFIYTYKDQLLISAGWQPHTRATYDSYGWSYPKIASYVKFVNVTVTDESGIEHDRDLDPRAYLQVIGKKISVV